MSFFNLSNNEQINATGTMEMGGGDIEPIPAKTQVKAAIEEAKWYDNQQTGERHISLAWSILAPKEYAGRKVFQKIKVLEQGAKKRDKALLMLAAIDKNAGGKLMAKGQEPTDDSLMLNLCNKPMVLLLQVWKMEIQGENKSGNWVSAVSPVSQQAQAQAAPVAPVAQANYDDIPFN